MQCALPVTLAKPDNITFFIFKIKRSFQVTGLRAALAKPHRAAFFARTFLRVFKRFYKVIFEVLIGCFQ
ncbi:MAG: hypothetical protein CVU27_01255 [Betaproteobacteria bacterium HGW-Betaproteobacteria-20]|jgi:hypothetical protein|nr:MAG: hypothetical protein CVU27_01255 [Betaproteobacteria bacterium HGW-Betaproteobacteria-20]